MYDIRTLPAELVAHQRYGKAFFWGVSMINIISHGTNKKMYEIIKRHPYTILIDFDSKLVYIDMFENWGAIMGFISFSAPLRTRGPE